MAKQRRYSQDFKIEAIRLADESHNKSQVCRDLGIHPSMLRKWEKQLEQNGDKAFPGKGHPHDAEMAQLQRENKRLKEEVEILKKAMGIFTYRPR